MPPWSEFVGASGYYDQPHVIRVFRALTGFTPSRCLEIVARYGTDYAAFVPLDTRRTRRENIQAGPPTDCYRDASERGIRDAPLNWLAVLLAAASTFVIGGLWYSLLFAGPWQRAAGLSDEQLKTGSARIFIGSFLLAASLAAFIGDAGLVFGVFAGAAAEAVA